MMIQQRINKTKIWFFAKTNKVSGKPIKSKQEKGFQKIILEMKKKFITTDKIKTLKVRGNTEILYAGKYR